MPEVSVYAVPEAQALATLRLAFRSPINFLDTAAAYGDGESERRIGLVLRERGGLPPGVVLSTKADRNLQTGEYSGDQIKRSVERSLRLLGVDHLQIVFLHDPEHTTFDNVMGRGGPLHVLQSYQSDGVIDHQMAALCRRYGVPLGAAALQFSLRAPRIVSTIVGVSRPERVTETLALAARPIPDELWSQLDQFAEWTADPEGSRWAPSG